MLLFFPRVRLELEDARNKGKDEEDVSILVRLHCVDAVAPGLPLTFDRGTAAERRPDGAEEAFHPGGDGPSADGEEPVQREADGAAGGGAVDRDDQVKKIHLEYCV